jgi:stringent starvation protein B
MKSSMPQLPRKKAVALDLLERTSVFVHLDPRRPGVVVPQGFLKQPQLVLQIGLNMAISIPDLDVGEDGISCTLSFNKRPHFCSLPWSSIYALIGEQGGGMVWPEDVPPEVVSQQRSAAKKETRTRKPGLRAVGGGTAAARDSADRNAESEIPVARATRSADTPSPLEGHAKEAVRRTSSWPPRLVPAAAPSTSTEAPAAAKTSESDAKKPDSGPRSQDDAARSAGAKRSRPPYLRLVD